MGSTFLEENFEYLSFLEGENYKILEVFTSFNALIKKLDEIHIVEGWDSGYIKDKNDNDILGKYRILKSGKVEVIWK
mgnify:CR=1 FL=1|tara:strand:- start:601 stop:831 length:231 start_codon:yes stop_codon:yes gene_type:complete